MIGRYRTPSAAQVQAIAECVELAQTSSTFHVRSFEWDAETGELRIESAHGMDEYSDTVDRDGAWSVRA